MRGALAASAFVVCTLLEGLLLHELPPAALGVRSEAMSVPFALIVAASANLVLVGAVAPWLSRRLERRAIAGGEELPPALRRVALRDRVAALLVVLGLLGWLAAGLASRPLVVAADREQEENARAVRDWVLRSGDRELVANLASANTVALAERFFRTCIRKRSGAYVCLLVDTSRDPPSVVRDRDSRPNWEAIGER
ncbi:hypothetical protein HRbin41_00087 [bacterium HR41]|nr:hypothetical protein HRbin41_00087 [bacterium HR41]